MPQARTEPKLRRATLDELADIDAVMKASTRDLFPRYYDPAETEASIQYIAVVDRQLVEDGTYFVWQAGAELVACGGWSPRDKLYTGSGDAASDTVLLAPATQPARVRAMFVRSDWTRRGLGTRLLEACEAAAKAEGFKRLALMATLPGVPLYERYGFTVIELVGIPMPNGMSVSGAAMEKPIG